MNQLWTDLHRELARAAGRCEALGLALDEHEDIPALQNRLLKAQENSPDLIWQLVVEGIAPLDPVALLNGYQDGLESALTLAAAWKARGGTEPSEISHLRCEALLAEGRRDALSFVLQCTGDLVKCIDEEMQDFEGMIAAPPPSLRGPLAPGSSPRIYRDGYLAGLSDALMMIKNC